MDMSGPSGFNQSMVKREIDEEFEVKKSEDLDSEMSTTVKVENEQALDSEMTMTVKMENEQAFDYKMYVDQPKLANEEVVQNVVVIKRWLKTVPFKSVVEGSSFVPFKMPFLGTNVQPCPREQRFGIDKLMSEFPNIGLIVDLSNNRRTYRVSDLAKYDLQYVNIPVKFEHQNSVPNDKQLNLFIEICSTYATKNSGKLIGVHDQLGNRATAYMICKVLEKMGLSMKEALKRFKAGRGCEIYAGTEGVLNGSRNSNRRGLPKKQRKSK